MRRFMSVLCVFLLSFTLVGCSSSYERNTTSGNVIKIQLYEAILMKKDKQSFVLMLSQSSCGFCIDFKETLKSYLKDHHVQVYEVVLDEEIATESENLMIIEHDIKNFSSTPGLFYFKEGKQLADLQPSEDGISEKAFDDWVVAHRIDEKK